MSPEKPLLRRIPIEHLLRNKSQPRQQFDKAKLEELALSIRTIGHILQPILVREIKPPGQEASPASSSPTPPSPPHESRYEIIAGERRWRAAQMAGLDTVECLVRHFNDEQVLEASIIENVTRHNLNPVEEAKAYQRMIEEFHYTHDEVAACVGKKRSGVTNIIRLLTLDAQVQHWLTENKLSLGHGKVLAGLPSKLQYTLAKQCINNRWSVRQLERQSKQHTNTRSLPKRASTKHQTDPNIAALENKISEQIGCNVKILYKKNKGRLYIDFHGLDILSGLLKKLGVE